MKLLALVLALSCVIAYTTARKEEQYWPTNTKIFTTSRPFRREADPQDSMVANLRSTPRLPFDDIKHLVLFDNEHTTDEDDNKIPVSQSRSNALRNYIYRIDENDYLAAYTFHPGAYGGFAQTFGTGGGFRWRREAERHVEPRFRSKAKK